MKPRRGIALLLITSIPMLPACSAIGARMQLESFQQQLSRNTEAWISAQTRLVYMCPPQPKTREEYEAGVVRRAKGDDPFRGCDARLIKLTNAPRTDDWQLLWYPEYRTVVRIHDEELRKRVSPKVYDEYLLALSKVLAERADRGAITQQQFVAAFNEGWKWLFGQMQTEKVLLQDSVRAAQEADARLLEGLAVGLAVVATTALVVAATMPAAPPPPALQCHAHPAYLGNQIQAIHVACF